MHETERGRPSRIRVISGVSLRKARIRFATRGGNMLSSSPRVLTLNKDPPAELPVTM